MGEAWVILFSSYSSLRFCCWVRFLIVCSRISETISVCSSGLVYIHSSAQSWIMSINSCCGSRQFSSLAYMLSRSLFNLYSYSISANLSQFSISKSPVRAFFMVCMDHCMAFSDSSYRIYSFRYELSFISYFHKVSWYSITFCRLLISFDKVISFSSLFLLMMSMV